jgi:hypothetical protein
MRDEIKSLLLGSRLTSSLPITLLSLCKQIHFWKSKFTELVSDWLLSSYTSLPIRDSGTNSPLPTPTH